MFTVFTIKTWSKYQLTRRKFLQNNVANIQKRFKQRPKLLNVFLYLSHYLPAMGWALASLELSDSYGTGRDILLASCINVSLDILCVDGVRVILQLEPCRVRLEKSTEYCRVCMWLSSCWWPVLGRVSADECLKNKHSFIKLACSSIPGIFCLQVGDRAFSLIWEKPDHKYKKRRNRKCM